MLPAAPGVYRFRDDRGRALYVGRAIDLRRRVLSYWGDLRDRPHLRRMVPRIARVEAVVCDSGHEAAWLERNLLEHRKPYWNRARGGQEVPVYLRLDARAVTIVHEHQVTEGRGRIFGPYLGGSKVRLATSALDRALPLAYADPGRSGFSRDMARVLGIAPTDRDALIDAVTATLAGDSSTVEAVRTELAHRRDAAAAALAFELAARVQLELEALDWITAEQKVTTSTLDDVDVCGWAGGVLVRLEIRSGRMRAWSQRTCAEPQAATALAATPPRWRPFAQRTADLAARLEGALTPASPTRHHSTMPIGDPYLHEDGQ
jgi:excinuclease ABC subunit C